MIKRLLKYSKAQSIFHDLYDDQLKHRIEVKFSIVQRKAETAITEDTVLRCIEESLAENRMVAFSDWKRHKFDCNIQQVKRVEFDILYYGLFFADQVVIFHIESKEIKENIQGGRMHYSDFQHKGNVGEGQFHINQNTLQIHIDHYLQENFL